MRVVRFFWALKLSLAASAHTTSSPNATSSTVAPAESDDSYDTLNATTTEGVSLNETLKKAVVTENEHASMNEPVNMLKPLEEGSGADGVEAPAASAPGSTPPTGHGSSRGSKSVAANHTVTAVGTRLRPSTTQSVGINTAVKSTNGTPSKESPAADQERNQRLSQDGLNRLLEHLFKSYHKEVPPVPHTGGALQVGVGLNFVKFLKFNAVEGTMEGTVDMRLFWTDTRLSFHALDFFNVSWDRDGDKIPLRSDLIWTPDVTVLNQVGDRGKLLKANSAPLLLGDDAFRSKKGVNVMWSRPLDVKGTCDVDMSQYPFDRQSCHLDIGSWASSQAWMKLVPQRYFEEHTIHTAEFHVNNITMRRHNEHVEGSDQTFEVVRYSLVLQRYPHYYVLTFILPMVAMTLLTVATMWMNADNMGQRINAGTKLLLCVVSIIFLTAKNRPAIHRDIWIDRFQTHCLASCMSSVLESLVMDYLSKKASVKCCRYTIDSPLIDSTLRGAIIFFVALIVFIDARKVERYYNEPWLYASFRNNSTKLMGSFVYMMLAGLLCASAANMCRMIKNCLRTDERRAGEKAEGENERGNNKVAENTAHLPICSRSGTCSTAASSSSPFLGPPICHEVPLQSGRGGQVTLPYPLRESWNHLLHEETRSSQSPVLHGVFLPLAGLQQAQQCDLSTLDMLKWAARSTPGGSYYTPTTDALSARYSPLSDGTDGTEMAPL